MPNSLPKNLNKYFWGDDLSELNWKDNQKYITQVLLEKGDIEAANWLLNTTDKAKLLAQLSELKLSEKSKNFWQIYLSA